MRSTPSIASSIGQANSTCTGTSLNFRKSQLLKACKFKRRHQSNRWRGRARSASVCICMGSTADFTRRANPSQINFLPYMFFICICPQQVRMDRLSRSFGSALSSHFCLVQISSTFISPRFDWSVSSECRSLNRLSQSKSVLSSHTRVIHKYVLPTVLQPTAVTTVTATCLKVLSARFTILNHKSGLVYHLLFRPRSLSVHPLVYKHLICLGLFLQGMQSLDVSVLSV